MSYGRHEGSDKQKSIASGRSGRESVHLADNSHKLMTSMEQTFANDAAVGEAYKVLSILNIPQGRKHLDAVDGIETSRGFPDTPLHKRIIKALTDAHITFSEKPNPQRQYVHITLDKTSLLEFLSKNREFLGKMEKFSKGLRGNQVRLANEWASSEETILLTPAIIASMRTLHDALDPNQKAAQTEEAAAAPVRRISGISRLFPPKPKPSNLSASRPGQREL